MDACDVESDNCTVEEHNPFSIFKFDVPMVYFRSGYQEYPVHGFSNVSIKSLSLIVLT